MPRSQSFTAPSAERSTLGGLRSRCAMPEPWRYVTARRICARARHHDAHTSWKERGHELVSQSKLRRQQPGMAAPENIARARGGRAPRHGWHAKKNMRGALLRMGRGKGSSRVMVHVHMYLGRDLGVGLAVKGRPLHLIHQRQRAELGDHVSDSAVVAHPVEGDDVRAAGTRDHCHLAGMARGAKRTTIKKGGDGSF